ncbi:MAG: IS1 family transposase [Endozoicomonas sp. (ex Botrylloides leachii)]|nr:IS1 family transposase [Endozoicomonas sp. (ex Botrylloides leachii)]
MNNVFRGNKKNQRWLFYAWEPRFKRVIAHALGRRSSKALKKLLEKLKPYKISYYCTDDWKPYCLDLPEHRHVASKVFTQRIEGNNLNFRTRSNYTTK